MKVLSIDTSSKNCSIAIIDVTTPSDFRILSQKNSNDERTHSQKLMPMIEEIFKETNLSLNDIDLLACCVGPGSFTGIRIGIATVKAFCDSQNIPVVGVTSLESLSYNLDTDGTIFSIIDAKNENVYVAGFSCKNKIHSLELEAFADNISNALNKCYDSVNLANNIHFIGDGSSLFKDLINTKFAEFNITFSDDNEQSAVSLAKCAYQKYLNNIFGDSNSLSPIYLRKSQAERIADGESN